MSTAVVASLLEKTKDFSIEETLSFLANEYPNQVVFSTSFGQEDQVITDFIGQNQLPITVFTLDTGRLFQETYDVFHKTGKKYKTEIKTYFPETAAVESLLNEKGPNSFYSSVENRKECCGVRKIAPLKRALAEKDVWITGLRQAQSQNRAVLDYFSYDEHFDILKFNPLARWELTDVNAYLSKNKVPQNSLHTKGFVSIGCAPCTRAIEEGEDIRAGRWWWESSKKGCGLHTIKS